MTYYFTISLSIEADSTEEAYDILYSAKGLDSIMVRSSESDEEDKEQQ